MRRAFGPYFFVKLLLALFSAAGTASAERLQDMGEPGRVESLSSRVDKRDDTVDSEWSIVPF
jgi:hypothetical protein